MSANSVVFNALQTALKLAQEKHAVACAEYEKVKEEVNDTGNQCAALYEAIAKLQVVELPTPPVVSRSTPQVEQVVELPTPLVSRSMQAVSRSTPQVEQVVELPTPLVSRSMQAVSRSTQAVSQFTQAVSRSTQAVSQSTPQASRSTQAVSWSTQAVSQSTPQVVELSPPQVVELSPPQVVSQSTALVPRSPEVVHLSTLQVGDQDTSWSTVKKTGHRTMCTVITNSMFDATSPEEAEEVLYEIMGDVKVEQVLQTHRGDWKIKFVMSTSSLEGVNYRFDHDGKKVWRFKDLLDIRTFNPKHVPTSYGRTNGNGSDNGSNGSGPSLITMGDFL